MNRAKYFDIIGVGKAYVDETAVVDKTFVEKFAIPVDGSKLFRRPLLEEIRRQVSVVDCRPGGSVANSLCTSAHLGSSVGFFGKIGNDPNGEMYLIDMRKRGIPWLCDPNTVTSRPTALCIILHVPECPDVRSIAYDDGCSEDFECSDFNNFDLVRPNILLIEGQLFVSRRKKEAIQNLLQMANGKCQIAVTLSGVANWNKHGRSAELIARNADIICGNSIEVEAFFSIVDSECKCATDQIVIKTMGKNGVLARSNSENYHQAAVHPIKISSGTGAGDAFLGAYLYATAQSMPIGKCLEIGAQAATRVLESVGGRL